MNIVNKMFIDLTQGTNLRRHGCPSSSNDAFSANVIRVNGEVILNVSTRFSVKGIYEH